jgi:hypothetical protein
MSQTAVFDGTWPLTVTSDAAVLLSQPLPLEASTRDG